MDRSWKIFSISVMRYIDQITPPQALLLVAVVIVGGLFCMRGFGSRAEY